MAVGVRDRPRVEVVVRGKTNVVGDHVHRCHVAPLVSPFKRGYVASAFGVDNLCVFRLRREFDGFGSDVRLKVAFRRAYGVSMRDWRRRERA